MKQSKNHTLIAGLFIFLMTMQPAWAQHDSENTTLVGWWPFGSCRTSFAEGNYAYVGNGCVLDILDVSDISAPERVGRVTLPSAIRGIHVVDGYAYVADTDDGLRIVDVSDPAHPMEIGFYKTRRTWDVYVEGRYAYLACFGHGLRIVDVSDPTQPVEIASYETGCVVNDVYVSGGYVYAVCWAGDDLHIIDINDPMHPAEVAVFDAEGGSNDVYVSGNYAYLANGMSGLRIIDVSDPAHPAEIGFYDTPGNAFDVNVVGGYAYVADGSNGLRIIDVNDTSHPVEVGFCDTLTGAGGVYVAGHSAFVAEGSHGLHLIDVSDISHPVETGFYETGGSTKDVYVSGRYAYVANGWKGLRIFDINDPSHPAEIGYLDTEGFAEDVCVSDHYAYLADYSGGLHIIDISNPSRPTEVGFHNIPGLAHGIDVSSHYAYVANDGNGLRIIDVSDPVHPVEVGFYDTAGRAYDVVVSHNYAYVADWRQGLRIIDVSDPTHPAEIGFYDTENYACGVDVFGRYVFVTDRNNGLIIIDISDPTHPAEIGFFDTEGSDYGVQVSGRYAYVANWEDGLRVIDVNDPTHPVEVGFYDTGGKTVGVFASPPYVYVADEEGGFYILQNDLLPLPSENETKLTADDGEANDFFGRDVAIDGVYAVVGAPYDDNEKGADAGAAYIYKLEEGAWVQIAKLIPNDGADEDLFGYSVDIQGDYVAVGACWDDDAGEKSGSAYIFKNDGTDNWDQQAKVVADDAGEDNRFGIDLAIDRGYLIVGAFFDDDFGTRSGSAYIFKQNGPDWTQQTKLTASDAAEGDWFGVSVDMDGDYAVVGARYDDNENGEDTGAVYVFKREDTAWNEQAKLMPSDGAAGDLFHEVAISGDWIVVGAYQDDDNGDNSGSAYLFRRDGETWLEDTKLVASDGSGGDMFGASVAVDGNLLCVGAYKDDDNGENSGSVYLFEFDGTNWNGTQKTMAFDGEPGDYFGLATAVSHSSILIGARNDDDNGENAGAAYVYELRTTPETIHVPADYPTIRAAMEVAHYGDTLLVAPGTYSEFITMRDGVVLMSVAGPQQTIISANGGSQLVTGAQDAVISGFTIAGNNNGDGLPGNGIYSDGDNLTIRYCIIRDNRVGVYLDNGSQAMVYNNTIFGNNLAGIYMQIEPSPRIYNNIICKNTTNAIFRNTTHSLGSPFIQYNCYYGNGTDFGYLGDAWTPEPGVGAVFAEPMFIGGSPFDFHLTSDSPCIDAGDPASPLDPDGSWADMGALYYWHSSGGEGAAFIYTGESADANVYKAFLDSIGVQTTLIEIADVSSADLTSFGLIIIGSNTGYMGNWGDPSAVANIQNSGKPVLGLGFGGASFFQQMGLSINWSNGWIRLDTPQIYCVDPSLAIFNTPNLISIPEDHIIELYTNSSYIAEYAPSLSSRVVLVGRESDNVDHYPIVSEGRHWLWGFTNPPTEMTQTGKDLFANIVNYIAPISTLVNDKSSEKDKVPKQFRLHQNYPNPFNPTTTIEYDLPQAGFVELTVHNVLGREIRRLVHHKKTAGRFSVQWDGRDDLGEPASSGVYFYRIKVRTEQRTMVDFGKMILMK